MESFEEGTIKKILYIIVMQEEASCLLDNRPFKKDEIISAKYSNILDSYSDGQIILIVPKNDPINNTGLFGTEIAFFLTYVGIMEYKPDVVISMGYAGDTGVDEKLPLGAVVIAKEKAVYHRRNMLIEIFSNTCKGNYSLHGAHTMVKDLGYCSHLVGTSNSFVKHDEVAKEQNIKVVEMELCSVARACSYFKTPCIGVKIISDTSDCDNIENLDERQNQFLESLKILKEKFYEAFDKVNTYLLNKNINYI